MQPPKPILSPCIGLCQLGDDGLCEGCFRSVEEITRWSTMTEREREWIMQHILPAREAARS